MTFKATVVYPNEPDATFDLDYYLKTHMPLVQENWGKYGLKHWEVIKVGDMLDGSKAPYTIQAILTFESADSVKTATSSAEAKTVFGDVPNFSNKGPVFLGGDVVGQH